MLGVATRESGPIGELMRVQTRVVPDKRPRRAASLDGTKVVRALRTRGVREHSTQILVRRGRLGALEQRVAVHAGRDG